MNSNFITINWSPFATNPLDHINDDRLVTSGGKPVVIGRSGNDFTVTIDGDYQVTGGNIHTCYFLNTHAVGKKCGG